MRTGTITIGGKPYPIKGLTVAQALELDVLSAEANAANDTKAKVDKQLRRMAISLQNAKAFLPDPSNPKGEFAAADLKIEVVVGMLADGDLFDCEAEYYEAAAEVMKLAGFMKSDAPGKVSPTGQGESQAPELSSGTSDLSVA